MQYKEKLSTAPKPDYEDSICRKWWNGEHWTIEFKWLNPKLDEITDEQIQKANDWIDGKKSCIQTVDEPHSTTDNQ